MSENGIDRDRRQEIARDALDIGMDDPYWLHNLAQSTRFSFNDEDGSSIVARLREDADRIEEAHEKIEAGEWTPAEAALYISEGANFGDYDTHDHLYDSIPIQSDE